jgi:hypothetical protein
MTRDAGPEWQVIWRGDGEARAELVAGQLRSHGIDAIARGMSPGSVHGLPLYRANAWTVSVAEDDATEAQAVLRGTGEGRFLLEPEAAADISSDQRATLVFAAIGVIAVLAFLLYAAAKGSL